MTSQPHHRIFMDLANFPSRYLEMVGARKDRNGYAYRRIEPRTRKKDFADALSFKVFDPLWMLTRQWQFGRFKGNDCGSAVTTKVKVSRRRLDGIYLKRDPNARKEYSTDTPMEYDVEKRNRQITPFIRIESAIHFKKLIEKKLALGSSGKPAPGSEKKRDELVNELIRLFPLDPFIPFTPENEKSIDTLKAEQNSNLKRLYAAYGKRIFDGYKLFDDSAPIASLLSSLGDILEEYKKWFVKKYLPIEKAEDNCWNEEKLGYEIGIGENANIYEAEDYHTGRLSWYSFDGAGNFTKAGKKEEKMLSYLPVPADFPGAPSRLLWEFEDAHVQFGHQANDDFTMLSNAVVMQYVTLYGNDWMITPIEAETGTVLHVEGIIVTDTFGDRIFIDTSAEQTDQLNRDVAFTDRWNLYGTTKADAYKNNDFTPLEGLLFPPTLVRCEESDAIEEVQFLRDEMANMLWGVETIIGDGCDGILTGKDLSDAVLSVVDAQKNNSVKHEQDHDYSLLVQNRVPIHWIPFIPQKIAGERRDIRFRRGRMPVFYNGAYQSVRPSTELLKIREESKTVDGKTVKIVLPRFINEEEVTGYGVKLVLTAQRTRWFLGRSFNWTGAQKIISRYQANSGLMFDDLIDRESGRAITLDVKNKKHDSEESSD